MIFFITSAVVALVASILLVPMASKRKDGTGPSMNAKVKVFIAAFILILMTTMIVVYVTKMDMNWLAFTPAIVVLALLGAIFAMGTERKVKGAIFLVSLLACAYLFAAPLLNANDKFKSAEMKEKVELTPFDETKKPASVPPKFVRNKMKKAFGQVPDASYYELGSLQIQKVAGDYVYVAPVEFTGFFRWMKGDTTPGYFMMSATDSTANPKFIKQEMRYIPSAYLNKNLTRHMRLNHPKMIFYGKPQMEVNDDGKPYYIRSYGEYISARDGFDVKGLIMVDAQSGKIEQYALKDVPKWVDGAIAPEVVSLQNSYYGNYIHGFWNSVMSKKDVKLPSDEGTEANVSPVFDENGDMYYFTDFTSPKKGVDSMLGYSLTNAQTGEATYYTGDLSESYMDSQGALQIIEKKFIEKKWKGQMPILYNFYGEASWLTPVLDANGFLQNYFIVSAANPEISVFATTPQEALKLYKVALTRGGSTVENVADAEERKVTGKVQRVYKERIGDYTMVNILLDNGQNFIVSTEAEPLAIYIEVADELAITYGDTGEQFLPIKEVELKGLKIKE